MRRPSRGGAGFREQLPSTLIPPSALCPLCSLPTAPLFPPQSCDRRQSASNIKHPHNESSTARVGQGRDGGREDRRGAPEQQARTAHRSPTRLGLREWARLFRFWVSRRAHRASTEPRYTETGEHDRRTRLSDRFHHLATHHCSSPCAWDPRRGRHAFPVATIRGRARGALLIQPCVCVPSVVTVTDCAV